MCDRRFAGIRTFRVLTALAVLSGLSSLGQAQEKPPAAPQPLPAKVVEAWTAAGAQVGWLRPWIRGFLIERLGEERWQAGRRAGVSHSSFGRGGSVIAKDAARCRCAVRSGPHRRQGDGRGLEGNDRAQEPAGVGPRLHCCDGRGG